MYLDTELAALDARGSWLTERCKTANRNNLDVTTVCMLFA